MKSKSIRILAASLAALMIVCTFSCAENNGGAENNEPAGNNIPDVNENENISENVTSELPDVDYGGYDFKISVPEPFGYDMFTRDALNKEPLNDAIYDRNLAISERFGINIKVISQGNDSAQSQGIIDSVLANDHAYDLAAIHTLAGCAKIGMSGSVLDWNELTYVDFSKPWWNKSLTNTSEINGNILFAAGAINWAALDYTFVVFFNKDLMLKYGISDEDVYRTVREKKWTYDQMVEWATLNIKDDGDGIWNENDNYGLLCNNQNAANAFFNAFGQFSVIKENEGYRVTLGEKKSQEIVEKVYDLLLTNNYNWIHDYNGEGTAIEMFSNGQAMFYVCSLQFAKVFKDTEVNYGIIPYPLFDENQEDYITSTDAWGLALCVPSYCEDKERTGIVTEALCEESYKTVLPAFNDNVVNARYTQDLETAEMIGIINDSIVYDFGYMFDNWTGAGFAMSALIQYKTRDMASYVATYEGKITAYYDGLFEKLNEYYY